MTTPQDLAAQIEALAPCPFCGGEGAFKETHLAHWIVGCQNCGLRHPTTVVRQGDPFTALVDAWNTRPAIVAAIRQGEGADDGGLEAAAQYHDKKAARWRKEAKRHRRPSGNSPCMDRDIRRALDHEGYAEDLRYMAKARAPAPDERDDEVRRLKAALEWYGEQARLARLIHSEGDAGRHALADDGGKRASAALSPAKGGE